MQLQVPSPCHYDIVYIFIFIYQFCLTSVLSGLSVENTNNRGKYVSSHKRRNHTCVRKDRYDNKVNRYNVVTAEKETSAFEHKEGERRESSRQMQVTCLATHVCLPTAGGMLERSIASTMHANKQQLVTKT
jgi:hypothetical protein